MQPQTTNLLLMVRPANFHYNAQTAGTNAFQNPGNEDVGGVAEQAAREFDALTETLRAQGIRIHVVQDTPQRETPDSLFPNNWVSFHNGIVHLYPMCTLNRRRERSVDFILDLVQQHQLPLEYIRDFSFEERQERFLEGTGSIVFDHYHRRGYGCLSERTHPQVFEKVCRALGYQPVLFEAQDAAGQQIYHSNVMMSIGENFAVICSDSISNPARRQSILDQLTEDGKEIIDISLAQMNAFCGNILQLHTRDGNRIIALSTTAYQAFTPGQRDRLSRYGRLVDSDIATIEQHGGGSVRCMLCEVQ